jgi:hypothetical protein
MGSAATEDRLYVVAVGIEHEGSVVAGRVTGGGVAKPGRAVIGPARLQGGRVEGVDLSAAPGGEGCMLPRAMGVKTVNPEHWVIDTITDAPSFAGVCMTRRRPSAPRAAS